MMVTNVTSLLKTVKSVEDEATRGTRALEATIDAIVQEARVSVTSTKDNIISFYKVFICNVFFISFDIKVCSDCSLLLCIYHRPMVWISKKIELF